MPLKSNVLSVPRDITTVQCRHLGARRAIMEGMDWLRSRHPCIRKVVFAQMSATAPGALVGMSFRGGTAIAEDLRAYAERRGVQLVRYKEFIFVEFARIAVNHLVIHYTIRVIDEGLADIRARGEKLSK